MLSRIRRFRTISGRRFWKTAKARSQAPESRNDLDGKSAIGFRSRSRFIGGTIGNSISEAFTTASRDNDDLTQFWFHYKYLDEHGRQYGKGHDRLVHGEARYSGRRATRVAKTIDTMFANSPYETKNGNRESAGRGSGRSSSEILTS